MFRRLLVVALPLVVCVATPAIAAPQETLRTAAPIDPRLVLARALEAETKRAAESLKLGDNPPPFFIGLQVKSYDSHEISGKFGALLENHHRRYRNLFADVRVGSHAFDSTPDPDALGFDFDLETGSWSPDVELPLDDDPAALRHATWLLIDDRYKRALASHLKKRGRQVYRPDDAARTVAFSHETPVIEVEPPKQAAFDGPLWSREVRRATGQLATRGPFFDAAMRVTADHVVRVFVSTEGSRIVTEQLFYGLHLTAWARADDGMLLTHVKSFYGRSEGDLPRGAALDAAVRELSDELVALTKAPVVDPFTGPALLSPQATGVLFHEAIGHRLEGERQDDDNEGRTFKGQLGQRLLPAFIDVFDDPTLTEARVEGARAMPLNGHYRFDEQGVPAQRAGLVRQGILEGYLMSRRPVAGFTRSNGYGRSAGTRPPVARMANLVIRSSAPANDAELKGRLLEETRRQGKPYGIFIKEIAGGNTNTSGEGYQAFKGLTRLVYRVHAADGREELVRGVELVGTPLSTINRIVALGSRVDVFNGFCGAESGHVPVSTVAPAALVGEIELQRSRNNVGRPPLLDAPPR